MVGPRSLSLEMFAPPSRFVARPTRRALLPALNTLDPTPSVLITPAGGAAGRGMPLACGAPGRARTKRAPAVRATTPEHAA